MQVVLHPLREVHAPDAAADVHEVQCTQLPITKATSGLKRTRKARQSREQADVGETTPTLRRGSRARKLTTAECGLEDMTLQTPMPQTDSSNELGPPPPESTPAPKHGT